MQTDVLNIVVVKEVAKKARRGGFVAENDCRNMSSDVVSELQ